MLKLEDSDFLEGFIVGRDRTRELKSYSDQIFVGGSSSFSCTFINIHYIIRRYLLSWCMLIFSFLAILSHAIFYIIWAVEGDQWSVADAQWAKLMGYLRCPSVIYFLVIQLLVASVALLEIYGSKFGLDHHEIPVWGICSHLRVLCCLLLPAVQLVVGISRPSWTSLPFLFVAVVGLWWRYLLLYAGLNMAVLYVYQLPIEFTKTFMWVANFLGLYKISAESEWSEICSGLSFCFLLHGKHILCDLMEMDFIMSSKENSLTEQLLPSKHSFFIRQSSSFRTFCINFFTYGFPISLLALSFWSFHFASLCTWITCICWSPSICLSSVFHLHHLNGLLLDMEIWETIGLWHYPIPGFYLLAQFCLGILIALGNLVSNSVFLYLSIEKDNPQGTIHGDCKSSRAIVLALIFLIATKPGFIHAVYMIFFMIHLLSHTISRRIRQALIVLCEGHFALLYILQLNLISKALEQKGSLARELLSQSGKIFHYILPGILWDFLKIAVLACFVPFIIMGLKCSSHFQQLCSMLPPSIGFSVLKAGLNKSVLLSVYTSTSRESQHNNSSHERRIALYLSAVGKKFLSAYRSCGTYIAFLTILVTLYLVKPNYTSFGYLLFLLLWMSGRQLVEKTKRRLWFPLKVYAVAVFMFVYCLSVFLSFETWVSTIVDPYTAFGYNPEASILKNIWESLAVLIVMQLYSYERRNSKNLRLEDRDALELGAFAFVKRLLIWHSEKILFLALLYASLSPISAFGFYVGGHADMFPGQKSSYLSLFLGLRLFSRGFSGLESGLRGKVLVIIACVLQYNVFHWLENMPNGFGVRGEGEGPCALFGSAEEFPNDRCYSSLREKEERSSSLPSFNSGISQCFDLMHSEAGGSEGGNSRKSSCKYAWGSPKEGDKWNKKRILVFRKERLDMQKTALKLYIKYGIENMFSLFGLEINMIALLLASFAVLNAISLLYIASVAACVILHRQIIQKLWPMFVFSFASVIILEYLAIWLNLTPWKQHAPTEEKLPCHDCWRSSDLYFDYCRKCWLGIVVDDPRMLISYYVVFMLACFKFRADCLSSLSEAMWTFIDYLRLYSYCHLLDLVLALILITGTLEYDILHLGYLGFAMVFFRMRLEILKKKNKIFKFLRMYNFALIVLSLAYQSPFVGDFSKGKWEMIDYITLVEIIIFMLVSLQSYMFSSQEFDYVSKYLEAEQIGAIVSQQEKRAAWKTAQLLLIRKSEEQKRHRNLQVEKMKSEMLNLQIQLQSMSTNSNCGKTSPRNEGLRRRWNSSLDSHRVDGNPDKGENELKKEGTDSFSHFNTIESPERVRTGSPSAVESRKHSGDSLPEIIELKEKTTSYDFLYSDQRDKAKSQGKENPIISAVHLIGDGVSQVQSLGNLAVNNLVSFLNIDHEEPDSNEPLSEDGMYDEIESQEVGCKHFDRTFSRILVLRVPCRILHSCKLFAFYGLPCALFLYALCVTTGPGFIFWIVMLIYTEMCILLQYLYQIIIQHSGLSIHLSLLQELGFPSHKIVSSFVISNLPLFWCISLLSYKPPLLQERRMGGTETPPYFVQLSMEVNLWPEDGIQPERIESGVNKVLNIVCERRCKEKNLNYFHLASRVRVQSIERSPENPNIALAVFEVVYASPSKEFTPVERYQSLTPAADVANEILKAQLDGMFEETRFPYPILSVIGGGKEIDLYAYIFCADLTVFFLVAIFYQSVIKITVSFLKYINLKTNSQKSLVVSLADYFFLIVLDRIIYLCSFAKGKVIFYVFTLILFTFSITKYAWCMEPSHQCGGQLALRAIYLTKAISLALQAIQIRFGIPNNGTLYCHLFLVKCDADLNRARHQQGQKQTRMTKFCNGICLFFILMCVIWAPMLMYSSGNPTNIANPIKDASIRIDIKTTGGRLTLFETTLCEKLSWDELDVHFNLDPQGYLSAYTEKDVQLICCQADASSVWVVPSMDIIFSWQFIRDRPKGKEIVKYELVVQDQDLPKPSEVMEVINGTANTFRIYNVYPRYFRVTGSGDVRFLEQAVDLVSGDLVLNQGNPKWWSFHDIDASAVNGCGELAGPMAIIVSEETPQGILGETLSKFSIWGLYITFVLAVGRFIRLQCSDLRMRIPFENLPSCDRLLAICEDIYAARAEGELEVEEVLYWTLVKIYRSPHMLLEYTKPD
ncbi:hypothetical protein AAG906_012555 [Vitis piasezkii]